MMVLRLLLATCLLPKTALSSFLWRSKDLEENDNPDPAPVVDKITAVAIADREALYLSLKQDYNNEGCTEKWGEFPSKTSTKLSVDSLDLKGGMVCNCGMMYDLASSAFFDEEDLLKKEDSYAVGASLDTSIGIAYANTEEEPKNNITKIESWVLARTVHSYTSCSKGMADRFPCKNVDMIAHLPLSSFKTTNTRDAPRLANDVWGWTSSDKREFVIWGVREGHYFIEVTNSDPRVLGFVPTTHFNGYALQHDMKVLGNFAYLGSEGTDHGIQIFDLTRLLAIDTGRDCFSDLYCQELKPDRVYHGNKNFPISYSHNIVVNEQNQNFVYVVGSESCEGGLHVIDVSDPFNPKNAGCFGKDGYVHDAQCTNYKGPDSNYRGKEICFCFDEDTVTIVDVTDKSNMQIISKTGYQGYRYTHQGWLSSDHSHLIFGDEVDEYRDPTMKTKTLVMNVENLKDPSNLRAYYGNSHAVDHNMYVIKANTKGQNYNMKNQDLIYQANYQAGMRILQVIDYELGDFEEVGYFDTYPLGNDSYFRGAWSVYPYFKSGLVIISSIEEGLFLVKPNLKSSLVGYDKCVDDKFFRYQNKKFRNCNWVAKSSSKRYRRKKCNKTWQGSPVSHYCPGTCGKVGLGPRKCIQRRKKSQRNSAGNANDQFQMIEAATIDNKKTAITDTGIDYQRRKHHERIKKEADEVMITL